MKKGIPILLLLFPILCFSQKVENLKAAAAGDKIIVTYDLSGGTPGDRYNISLFASSNNFSSPLILVTGDVGKGITEGSNKRIVWESKSELRNFKGQLSFEIQIEVIPAFKIISQDNSFKRGKTHTLQWRGGDSGQNVKLELYKAGILETAIGTVPNKGTFEWTIPSGQKPGGDYQLRLTNGSETIKIEPLSIKRKIPTLVKVLPVLVVGGAAAALGGGGSKSPGGSSAKNLAEPPNILN